MKDEFLTYQAQTSPHPLALEIDKASGSYIFTRDGKKYLDFISGISVSNLGHAHPKVLEAIHKQVDRHLHVMAYGEFIQESQLAYAKALAAVLPSALQCTYFVNSGAEAVEGALKLAKRVTGRSKFLSFKKSYHGNTHGALSVTGNEQKKYRFRPLLPGVDFIEFNKPEQLDCIDHSYAGLIIEPIQGDAGIRIPSIEFMQKLRKKCSDYGVQLIFDEIQSGFGRSGTLFAFEQFGVVPDILVLGKALGGGMHLGAFISSAEKMKSLSENPTLGHITTFGGHPVSCAAGLASLEALLSEGHVQACESKGKRLEEGLKHPLIREIRRRGLFMAVEMGSAEQVQQVVHYCLKEGLLSFWFLSCPESFRLAPPLNISQEEIDQAIKIIQGAMNSIKKP